MTFSVRVDQTLAYSLNRNIRVRVRVATLVSVLLHFSLFGMLLFTAIAPSEVNLLRLTLAPANEQPVQLSKIVKIEPPELRQEIQTKIPDIEVPHFEFRLRNS